MYLFVLIGKSATEPQIYSLSLRLVDTLTHTVTGAVIGELMLGRKVGKRAMLWGALANNYPDIDVAFTPLFRPADALFVHRGITHSFFFVLLSALVFGYMLSRKEKHGLPFAEWFRFFLLIIMLHPLADSLSGYGTGFFEPFSRARYFFNVLFIIDPLFTFPLLIGTVALLFLKRDSPKRKKWGRAVLVISSMYVLSAIAVKGYVENVFRASAEKQKISYSVHFTNPTQFNSILWNAILKTDSGFYSGYYSLFDRSKDITFRFIPQRDSLARSFAATEDFQKLKRFTQGYYVLSKEDDKLFLDDLRFGMLGDAWGDAPSFMFSFQLSAGADGGLQIVRGGRKSRFPAGAFGKLVKRIGGG